MAKTLVLSLRAPNFTGVLGVLAILGLSPLTTIFNKSPYELFTPVLPKIVTDEYMGRTWPKHPKP